MVTKRPNYLSLIVGFSGVALAIILYFKSKRDKEPRWSIRTVNLFKDYSGTVEGLEIQYRGKQVRDLSISKILFWNMGSLTIHRTDLSDVDPLRVEIQANGQILNATLLSINNNASQPQLTMAIENHVLINFDYLDRGQGFVIQITHEGTRSTDLQIKGAIKGVVKIVGYNLGDLRPVNKEQSILAWSVSLAAVGVAIDSAHSVWKYWDNPHYSGLVTGSLFIMAFCFAALFGAYVYLFRFSWVPPGLESFSADFVQEQNKLQT